MKQDFSPHEIKGLMSRFFHLLSVIILLSWYATPVKSQDLIISGVMDGDISIIRSIELYAVNDIPDLSIYSVRSAMNGSSTFSLDFPLSGSALAGDYIHIGHDAVKFDDFFGFTADFADEVVSVTGEDVLGLFKNGVIVDVFGELGVDGTGEPWEYKDGWAYRVDGTGPDGDTFVLGNWAFSGVNALVDESLNATAITPFPIKTYIAVDIDGDGYSTGQGDCNDFNDSIYPGATEVNDGIDNNCDGNIDEGFDTDGDGYSTGQGDCNDLNDSINPGATEVNDGIDNNCDGNIDEGFDNDGDGFSPAQGDCNDSNAAAYPGATEVNDGLDNNCNGVVDEGFDADGDGYSTGQGDCNDVDPYLNPDTIWYADEDGDGFGNPNNSSNGCVQPTGYVANNLDCKPLDPDVYPGAPAQPDGKDNDCDGIVDKVPQSITMDPIPDQVDERGSVTIVASSTSGLDLNYSIAGPVNLFNGILILTGPGTVTITASQAGDNRYLPADRVTVTFCVNPLPLISLFEEGTSFLTLQSNYDTGNQWYVNDSHINGANEQQYIVSESGDYMVKVSIGGCTGVSDMFNAVLTHVETEVNKSISLFPNPVHQYLNIELSNINNTGISEVFVINSNGSTVMRKSMNQNSYMNTLIIDVSQLKPGIYYLLIKTGDEVIRKRFSKQ